MQASVQRFDYFFRQVDRLQRERCIEGIFLSFRHDEAVCLST